MNASDGTNPNENNHDPSQANDLRKGKGRQKLPMKKIENETNLMVTFSKRRAGIFKKASELNILCGAESALVVFSPGEKIHSYGHPNVEIIANRFLNTDVGPTPTANPLLIAHHEATDRQLNQELVHKEELLMRERLRKKELDNMFQLRINEMSYEELSRLQEDVLKFKSAFESRFKEATSSGGLTNVQGTNPEQGGPEPSARFTYPGGFDMTGFPNAGDPTHWTNDSFSSYPAPVDPNTRYMVQYPCGSGISGGACGSNALILYNFNNSYGEAVFGDATARTSNTEVEDETQTAISNMSHGRGSRHKNGRGGRFKIFVTHHLFLAMDPKF